MNDHECGLGFVVETRIEISLRRMNAEMFLLDSMNECDSTSTIPTWNATVRHPQASLSKNIIACGNITPKLPPAECVQTTRVSWKMVPLAVVFGALTVE